MSKITFVACAYNEAPYNRQLLDSLMMQSNPNWECIVYHNGPNKSMKKWVADYCDKRIRYRESAVNNNNGCYNRLDAISRIADGYIVQTSVQDYYVSWAVELILKRLQEEPDADLCFWDSLNHLCGYEVLVAKLIKSHIDWGNFALRAEVAKQIGIPGIEPFGRREDDWYTVEKGLMTGMIRKSTKIANVLTIHN